MRKAIIAAIVATALFAVGAFAASFTVTAEDVASGSNDVVSCASAAEVDFTETFVAADNNWNVTGVTVTFTPVAGLTCVDRTATLVLQNQADAVVFSNSNTVLAGNTVSFTPADLAVGDVFNAAVLIDDDAIESVDIVL